eukprot:TRINITY_DN10988_c0_g1_i2.p1 TRINITY_DN10988_c0_g1~~TRINITY_DN10988_c0_g1_i2.p1  ORF type:complete len:293 (+),score=91.09 TRINITY_DN10988_c0_g1_i2:121-999(+)
MGWNCKGAFLFLGTVVMLVGTRYLIIALRKDFLLHMAIRFTQFKKRHRGDIGKKVWDKVGSVVLTLTFSAMQIFVLFLFNMLNAASQGSFAFHQSCSGVDHEVRDVSKYMAIIGLVAAFVGNFFVFAGNPTRDFDSAQGYYQLFAQFGHGVWRIVLMTFGYWNDEMVKSHNIISRSQALLDFDDDKVGRHEAVIAVTGKSRGLFWFLVPGAVFLAKTAEVLSAPTIWGRSDSLKFKVEYGKRQWKWLNNFGKTVMQIVVVFLPTPISAAILGAVHVPDFVFELINEVKALKV